MKKIFLAIVLCAMVCVNGYAKSRISITSGTNVFKTNATATFKLDLSSATWEDGSSLTAKWESDYDKVVSRMNDGFVDGINKNFKKFKIVSSGPATYEIVYKVTLLEQHQEFSGNWGQLTGASTGTITVTDTASGEVVCVIAVEKQEGRPDFTYPDRFYKAFEFVGWQIYKKL